MFEYAFMRNAALAILLISPMFGMLGTMIVSREMAFFSDALGHSALTGIALGVALGVTDANAAMMAFGIAFALLLNYIGSKSGNSTDTIISVFSSCSVAAGLAILSKGGNFSKYSGLLVGDILSIKSGELTALAAVFAVAALFYVCCFNWLHAVSVHRSLAKSRGIPVFLVENCFAVLIAVTVMLTIRWVGILIINALLILPAAASRNLSVNMREYHFFSVLFSLFSGAMGLYVSYYTDVATGPTIVIFASALYFGTYAYSRAARR